MFSHSFHVPVVAALTCGGILATLAMGSPVAAASWVRCGGTPYYQALSVKGVPCAEGAAVAAKARKKSTASYPGDSWSGGVGRWKCTVRIPVGFELECRNGSKGVRLEESA